MGKVVLDITVSLDGYVAGPNDSPELGLGVGGERLHEWVYELASWREPHGLEGGVTNASSQVMEDMSSSGAVVVGKRMFDNARAWGDDPPFHKPVFVLTQTAREPLTKSDTTFTFVTEGIESAIEQAKALAGDKVVGVNGGTIARQCLDARLLDEIWVDLVPVLLGGGTPFFEQLGSAPVELEGPLSVEDGKDVTHLRYRVRYP